MAQLHTIYDRACKRCLSLSKRSTILLINGLYDKNYPLDSQVDYHWTEHHDENLRRTLADTIITINHTDSYHIEIQMYPDEEIVMRVFEYSYHHAADNRNGQDILIFPSPKILYLYDDGDAPEYHELTIQFGEQGTFLYRIPTFKYLNMSLEELNQRKLIVLIPFQLLRLRRAIEKERTPENIKELKYLIHHDIIGTIKENVAVGNITTLEGQKLQRITLQLYRHIYEKYEEMEVAGVNNLAEEALILDIDIVEQELTHKITRRVKRELQQQVREEVKEEVREEVKEEVRAELTQQVTDEVTRQVTDEVTRQVTDEISQQKNGVIQKLIVQLQQLGIPEEQIRTQTGLSEEEFRELIS